MNVTSIIPNTQTIQLEESLVLHSGKRLHNVQICYTTLGKMNVDKSNVVWVFHALTANSNPLDWWAGMFTEDRFLNLEKDFIICANMLGSCYGTTGPVNKDFPFITIQDIVALHQLLQNHLKINHIKLGIGASMGGHQLLEWAVQEPTLFENMVTIATSARQSPWGIAFNEAQRMAIENLDSEKGLKTARAIAMLSYRSYQVFSRQQMDEDQRVEHFKASSYLRYQGLKLRKRFHADAYYCLTKAMDSHNVGRYRHSIDKALQQIKSNALVIGINTDILFPLEEQQKLANCIPNAEYRMIESSYGHDGFLIETKKINLLLKDFFQGIT